MNKRGNDIEKRIFEAYPVTKKEVECAQEKNRMDNLRSLLRKRLKNEGGKEKREFNR